VLAFNISFTGVGTDFFRVVLFARRRTKEFMN
jgi:hypothetical protein